MSTTMPTAPPLEATVLFNVLTQAEGPALDTLLTLLNDALRQLPDDAPKIHYAALMRLITKLTRRKEEAELAADPARRAGIERVGEHFARKAQSGFSALPLPE
jgi:hypothetical protein